MRAATYTACTETIRPITPSDAEALVAFHEALSPESQYLRFFTPHPHLRPAEVERFTNVDRSDRVALVAESDDQIVGVGRYDRLPERPDTAEVAFVVADDHQGHGIATTLLYRLADMALANGIRCFIAETLPDNQPMQRVFRDSGYQVTQHFADGVIHIDLLIDQ